MRYKLSKGRSKKIFRNTSGTHAKNNRPQPMRGGYRL